MTARQKVAVIAFILAAPIAAWAWAGAAAAPYPDGSACAGGVCPDDDDDFWCVQLFDNGPLYGDMLAFHPMLQSGMVTLETGWLQSFAPEAYAGVSTFGRPFLPTMDDEVPRRELRMRIRFPRPTRIDRLEFQMLWNQTAPIDGQLLRVWDTNTGTVLLDEPVLGVTPSGPATDSIFWAGDRVVTSLTIAGHVWANSYADTTADFPQLKITSLKIQGQGYNPFKPLTNCIWAPPIDEFEWCLTFDFTLDRRGWVTGDYPGDPRGYTAGVGLTTWLSTNNIARITRFTGGSWFVGGLTGVTKAVTVDYVGGVRGSGAGNLTLRLSGGDWLQEFTRSNWEGSGRLTALVTPSTGRPLNSIELRCNVSDVQPAQDHIIGNLTITRVTVYGVGPVPAWDDFTEVC